MELVSATQRAGSHLSLVGALLATSLGVCGFLGMGAALRRALPRPAPSSLSNQLALLEGRKDEIDVLFVGSSKVFRHVDPALFDELMAKSGRRTRSFNLGVPAMGGVETLFALREALAMEPGRLRWVLLDLRDPGHVLSGDNHLTERVAAWHDGPGACLAARMALESEEPWAWRLDQFRRHVVAFCYRLGNVGRLRVLTERWVEGTAELRRQARARREAGAVLDRGPALNGFAALDWAYPRATAFQRQMLDERRQAWLAQRADVLDKIPARRAEGWPLLRHDASRRDSPELTAGEQQLFQEITALVHEHGLSLAFMTHPDTRQIEYYQRAGERLGLVRDVLDLDDPQRHPELFEADAFYDRGHLGERGAALYTRALAARFAAHLDEIGTGP
jgi:hypothetical protein